MLVEAYEMLPPGLKKRAPEVLRWSEALIVAKCALGAWSGCWRALFRRPDTEDWLLTY